MICIPSARKGNTLRRYPGHRSHECVVNSTSRKRLSLLLVLLGLAASALALEDLLTVLVHLEGGDNDLGGSEGDRDRLAVALLADNCGRY
jgi:hypothetical protein